MSLEDLEQFALRPASRDVTIQCRITRDRRGMERGIYPTYYLHMEKEDGKKVRENRFFFFNINHIIILLCLWHGGVEGSMGA